MTPNEVRVGAVIIGPLLPEAIEVLAVVPLGDSVKLVGKGLKTGLGAERLQWEQGERLIAAVAEF